MTDRWHEAPTFRDSAFRDSLISGSSLSDQATFRGGLIGGQRGVPQLRGVGEPRLARLWRWCVKSTQRRGRQVRHSGRWLSPQHERRMARRLWRELSRQVHASDPRDPDDLLLISSGRAPEA